MIEQDVKEYLNKIDRYINESIELVEQAPHVYGQYIDNSGFTPELIISLNKLFEDFRKIYFIISDYVINDLAPDPFQDLDSSVHTFISTCDNCIFSLTKLAEQGEGNHWLINSYFKDCQKNYKKLLSYRKNPDICAISSCRLPITLKIDPGSRALLSISQKFKDSRITCVGLWLSAETSSAQLNIELESTSVGKQDLLDLALRCINTIKEDLFLLSQVKRIFVSFRTYDQLHLGWIQGSKDDILSFISEGAILDEFEKLLFICYLGDVVIAAQKLDDLVEHSSSLARDFEVKEILIEAANHLEILVKKAALNPDPLTDLTLKWSFQRALLNCMLILLKVISVTKDQDVAKRFIRFFGMFSHPDDVDTAKDYSKLFNEIVDIINILRLRYVVIQNTKRISLMQEIAQFPRIAIVQPIISLEKDYENFQLTKEGLRRHLEMFDEYIEKANQESANIIVFPEMFFPASNIQYLKDKSQDKNLIIVTGLDYEYDDSGKPINSCAISLPDGNLIKQRKLYASKYDSPNMVKGDNLSIFSETAIGDFSVFICFDYLSSQDLIKLRGVIDILFVVTLNPGVREYHEKAEADAYSYLYGFIIVVNAFDPYSSPPILGGSGFYGPFKTSRIISRFEEGEYGMMIEDLPLGDLRKAKDGEKIHNFKSLPASFERVDLSKDYPECEIMDIHKSVLQKIEESKQKASFTQKKDYESLTKSNISQNLEEDVKKNGYEIMTLEPSHHGIAARLSAFLLINKEISKKEIKQIIQKANEDIRNRQCYLNEKQESRYKGKTADVVWLYIFNERRHRKHLIASDFYNYYVCRTQWVNPKLDPRFSPTPIRGDDQVGEIEIQWSRNWRSVDSTQIQL